MADVTLFEFDTVDAQLSLVPLAARRLLDALGAKLSLEGWRSLSLEQRRKLLALGSADVVDGSAAREILTSATPAPGHIDPSGDPDATQVPARISGALDATRPLPNDIWCKLTALERWALDKIAAGRHPERLPRAYDEIVTKKQPLTHLNARGEAHMVAVTEKPITARRAVAASKVTMSEDAHRLLVQGTAPKGDVLATARIAGIMAAKQTSSLIPLCHSVQLTHVEVQLEPSTSEPAVSIRAEVGAIDRTGVEMEALVAASVAAMTIYDMLKAVDRSMVIGPTRLLEKSGGKSGEFRA